MKLNPQSNQYKRIHQVALRMILLERPDEAEAFLQAFLEGHPRDAETLYLFGVLRAQQGRPDDSAAMLQKALKLGLSAGRVIAGPRSLLKPLREHPFYRKLVDGPRNALVHGPMIGDVSDTSASVWVRTAKESTVQVICRPARASIPTEIRSTVAKTSPETDYTAVLRIEGLRPDTFYLYDVLIDERQVAPLTPPQQFQTFPPRGTASRFDIVFGGGAGYVPAHERMWNTIFDRQPRALLLLGDNVYIDDPESLLMQRYTYYRRQSRPEFRRLIARTPVFTIWDDHDFGTNDCWGGPLIDRPFWKKDYSWTTFRQNWPNPSFGGGQKQPGCWYTFSMADVDFIMLDCRYYRTNPKLEAPSMLGPVQLDWLKRTLAASHGTFKVLCSSVPWDFRTKGKSRDTWNGFQTEREKIFHFIEEQRTEGVVLMSADRHRSDAWRIERPNGYDFYEFNSSRLTNQHVHPTMEKAGALFSYNAKQSFGLVTFDTTVPNPTVTYRVVTIDGETVHTLEVHRSQLTFR